MRHEITESGVYDGEGKRVPRGTIVDGPLPAYLAGKAKRLPDAAPDAQMVVAELDPGRIALFKQIEDDLDDGGRTADGMPKVDALNDARPEDTAPFTAEERDALWAAIDPSA